MSTFYASYCLQGTGDATLPKRKSLSSESLHSGGVRERYRINKHILYLQSYEGKKKAPKAIKIDIDGCEAVILTRRKER